MAITAANLDALQDSTSGLTMASNSVSPTAERLVLVCFWVRNMDAAADPGDPATVIGGGALAYTKVTSVLYDTRRRLCIYRARESSYTAGAITATWLVNVRGNIHVEEFAGIDTSGTSGSGAIVQSNNATSAGATTLTVTLAAFGSADNASFGIFAHNATELTTPGTDFTELSDVGATQAGSETEWKLGDTDPVASWATSSACAALGVEIKAAAAGVTTRRYSLPLTGVG